MLGKNEIFGAGDDVDCAASETLDQHLLKRERLLACDIVQSPQPENLHDRLVTAKDFRRAGVKRN